MELLEKHCFRCNTTKLREAFATHRSRASQVAIYCRECHNAQRREYRHKYRDAVLCHYSGGVPQCKCCGVTTTEFLAIDHIAGGGSQHRKSINRMNIYDWLYKNKFPEGFRVLCHNCNSARGFYGYCPHETETKQLTATQGE